MHKNTTLSKEIDSKVRLCNKNKESYLQPSNNTLKRILQFASGYRAITTTDNKVIDICLN